MYYNKGECLSLSVASTIVKYLQAMLEPLQNYTLNSKPIDEGISDGKGESL